MSLGKILAALLVSSALAVAGQIVRLHNGVTIRVEQADRDGDQVFLTSPRGVTIMNASEIASIEQEPDPNKKAVAAPTVAPAKLDTKAMIRAAARTHGIPASIVESVASVESGFQTDAVSHKGAIGVMQLMPGTARQLGVDPNDVAQNIDGGTRLLRELLIRYQDDPDQMVKALAAYNAGPGAVSRYQGVPPYRETRQYVRKVLRKLDSLPASPEANQ